MKTYTAAQLVQIGAEQIDNIQKNCDADALEYIEEKKEDLSFLKSIEKDNLCEYYRETMEKYRLLYKAFVLGLKTEQKSGFPEHIYSINLKDGTIETDKNGRRINYTTEIMAPCTSSLLHYINHECNDLYIVFPPIKDIKRTIEKIIEEKQNEHKDIIKKNLTLLEEEPELPFGLSPAEQHCPTIYNLHQQQCDKQAASALLNISKSDVLPRDIYRLSITSRYPQDLGILIDQLEQNFPEYIKFYSDERNAYKKTLSENPRRYLDRKKIARISIPNSKRYFYVEFQFKQTNMFFAHIRSHSVYEQFRILDTKYKAASEAAKKKKNTPVYEELKTKAQALKKQCEEKRELCINIHKSAIHQSNMYVLNRIMWEDKNASGLEGNSNDDNNLFPKNKKGQYLKSIETLKRNYIVEDYEPFDGAMAFTTAPNEYLNKAYYLKMIGSLPESFDELGKNAKIHINKAWENLTSSDIKNFDLITGTAIKYQNVIRELQKKQQQRDIQPSLPFPNSKGR